VTLHRTQVIGVNLSGANLSGARLLLTNLSEADFYQTDLNKSIVTEDKTASDEIIKAEDADNREFCLA